MSSHVYLLNTIMHIFGFLGVTRTRQWHVPTGHKGCVGTTLRGVRVLQAKNSVSKSLSGCLWDDTGVVPTKPLRCDRIL